MEIKDVTTLEVSSSSSGSLDSLDSEHELMSFVYADELPTFEIHSLSASPIELEINNTENNENNSTLANYDVNIINKLIPFSDTDKDKHEMISLSVIDSQLEKNNNHAELKNLETIFEGVFLETPPKVRKYKDDLLHNRYSAQTSKKNVIQNQN